MSANDEYRSQIGAINRPENVIIRYVSVVFLSFHLHIFHWFIAPPSLRHIQGHSP
jgi:hypothetical protein